MTTSAENNDWENRYPKNFPIPPDKLSEEKLNLIVKQELTEWRVVKSSLPENPFVEREELFREYVFGDFDQVLEYMTKVAIICNTLPHHPRWENTWTTLKVYLTTWDSVHIITYKDIMLARHMEKIYKEYGHSYFNVHTGIRIAEEQKNFFLEIEQLKDGGNLEQAFNKLSQFISQPGEIKEREKIIKLIFDFNEFLKTTRLQRISDAEINTKTKYFQNKLEGVIKSFEFKPKVFFSYAWGEEKEKIVDDLYASLESENAFELVRDKVNLNYKGLISEFMKEIGKGSFVIVALSDKYLRSEYCMFELYELYRNSSLEKGELLKKIYPIRVEPLDLNNPSVLKEYFSYWKKLETDWKELVNDFEADQKKYRMIQSIRFSLTELLPFLNDINSKTTEILSRDDFAEVKNSIRQRISEAQY